MTHSLKSLIGYQRQLNSAAHPGSLNQTPCQKKSGTALKDTLHHTSLRHYLQEDGNKPKLNRNQIGWRWPGLLIQQADRLKTSWIRQFSPLTMNVDGSGILADMNPLLFGPHTHARCHIGHIHNLCHPDVDSISISGN
jgi:hypothetical protein